VTAEFPDTPLGLIAGEGELPKLVARGARAAGRTLAVVALRGCADPTIRELADTFRWRGIVRLGAWIRAFKRAGCREVVMAGRVRKATMFGPAYASGTSTLATSATTPCSARSRTRCSGKA